VQEEISQAISDALSDSLGVRRVQLDLLSGLQVGWLGITTALLGDIDAGRAMLQQTHALGWRGPASRALFLLKQGMLASSADERADISQLYSDWLRDDGSMPASQRDLARACAGRRRTARRCAAPRARRSPSRAGAGVGAAVAAEKRKRGRRQLKREPKWSRAS
jgi:hypothetical protein